MLAVVLVTAVLLAGCGSDDGSSLSTNSVPTTTMPGETRFQTITGPTPTTGLDGEVAFTPLPPVSCVVAEAAHDTPIPSWSENYRAHLDPDNNGLACE